MAPGATSTYTRRKPLKAPAFQFYPKDYESDENVKLMSIDQEGVYIRLLSHQWLEGSVPSEVSALAKICRISPARMARLWPGVAPCFPEGADGRRMNPRMAKDRAKYEAFRKGKSDAGKAGANARWKDGTAMALPLAGDSSSTAICNLQSATAQQTESVREVFDHWRNVTGHPKAVLDGKRRALIKARLGEYSVEQLKRAIDGCKASAFHQGANQEGKIHDALTLILRDAEHVERFIGFLRPAPRAGVAHGVAATTRIDPEIIPPTPEEIAELRRTREAYQAGTLPKPGEQPA